MIPRTIPTLQGFDIAGVNEASFEVGGDYYEFIPLPDDRWGIIIADVVGKGIGAALLVSAIRATLYALVGRELAARAVMRRANRFFYDSVEEGRYVTLFYAVLDVPSRRMIYVNAGHHPPIVLHENGEVEALKSGGVPLGMFEAPRYFEGFAELAEGDLMVLYTDGIVESSNAHDEHYGRGRLMTALGDVRTQSAEAICRRVNGRRAQLLLRQSGRPDVARAEGPLDIFATTEMSSPRVSGAVRHASASEAAPPALSV